MIYFNGKRVLKTIFPNTPLWERFDIIKDDLIITFIALDDFYTNDESKATAYLMRVNDLIVGKVLNEKIYSEARVAFSKILKECAGQGLLSNKPYYEGQKPFIKKRDKHMEGENENGSIYRDRQVKGISDELGRLRERSVKSVECDNSSTADNVLGKKMGRESGNTSRPDMGTQSDGNKRGRIYNRLPAQWGNNRLLSITNRYKNGNNQSSNKSFDVFIRGGQLILSICAFLISAFILIWVLSFENKKEDKTTNDFDNRLKKLEKVIKDYEDLQVPGGVNG